MSENHTPTEPQAVAAFVIGFDADGNPFINVRKSALNFETRREPTLLEIRRYISEVLMDLQAQATSEYVIQGLRPTNPSGLITPQTGGF